MISNLVSNIKFDALPVAEAGSMVAETGSRPFDEVLAEQQSVGSTNIAEQSTASTSSLAGVADADAGVERQLGDETSEIGLAMANPLVPPPQEPMRTPLANALMGGVISSGKLADEVSRPRGPGLPLLESERGSTLPSTLTPPYAITEQDETLALAASASMTMAGVEEIATLAGVGLDGSTLAEINRYWHELRQRFNTGEFAALPTATGSNPSLPLAATSTDASFELMLPTTTTLPANEPLLQVALNANTQGLRLMPSLVKSVVRDEPATSTSIGEAATNDVLRAPLTSDSSLEAKSMATMNSAGTLTLHNAAALAGGLAERIQWMVSQGIQSAQIGISPAELGPIELLIESKDGEVFVSLAAAQPAARDLLQDSLQRLRENLTGQGLAVGGLDVSSGNAQQQGDQPPAPSPQLPRWQEGRATTASSLASTQLLDLFV